MSLKGREEWRMFEEGLALLSGQRKEGKVVSVDKSARRTAKCAFARMYSTIPQFPLSRSTLNLVIFPLGAPPVKVFKDNP